MTDIAFVYNDSEFGWVSNSVELAFDIYLVVELKEPGYVVIKQYDAVTKEWSKVLVSDRCDDAKLHIFVEDTQKFKIYTSVEPKSMKYVNI